MFKKLLSNLPFNPSLIGKVAFYAKRMHRETSIRRLGLVFVLLAFFVQFFAVISPPEPTLAASTNDILTGGFTSRDEATIKCRNNTQNFGDIIRYYGLTCDSVATATSVWIRSTDYGNQLDSMGRTPQGPTIARTGKPTDEYSVNIAGGPYYMRNLWAWDSGAYSSYQVLKMTNSRGVTIMVMYSCGNLVTIGRYTPPPPPSSPPPPNDVCPNKPGTQTDLSQCDVCPNLSGVQLSNSECDVCPANPGVQTSTSQCDSCPNVAGIQTDTSQCDVCPNVPGTQSRTSQCDVCPNKTGIQTTADQCDVCPNKTGVQTEFSQCDVCPNRTGVQTNLDQCDVCPNVPGEQSSTSQCDVCPNVPGTQSNTTECKPCDKASDNTDTAACLVLHKKASNTTQHLTDTNGKTAKASDTIVYTLTTKNSGLVEVKNYVIEENVSDILEYADITDLHGGTLSEDKRMVRWPAVNIAAGATITKNLTIKVKSVIPNTLIPSSNPGGSYDLIMTNVYGDTVNIKLSPPVVKIVENTTSLPNTGPGQSLALAFTVTVFVAYFFARSRLIAKELDIVRVEYGSVGGM